MTSNMKKNIGVMSMSVAESLITITVDLDIRNDADFDVVRKDHEVSGFWAMMKPETSEEKGRVGGMGPGVGMKRRVQRAL